MVAVKAKMVSRLAIIIAMIRENPACYQFYIDANLPEYDLDT